MIAVDPLRTYATVKGAARLYGVQWCHLFDTENNVARLNLFAQSIGIPKRWYQISTRGTHPHYDLTPKYRIRAVRAGAVEMSREQLQRLLADQTDTMRQFAQGDRRYGVKTDTDGRVTGLYSRPVRIGDPFGPSRVRGVQVTHMRLPGTEAGSDEAS